MKLALKTAVAALAMVTASPAFAALTVVSPCSITTTDPDAVACAGFFDGNLLNNNDIGDINLALDQLIGGNFDPDAVWANLDPTKLLISGSGNDPTGTITFQQALLGQAILGVHFGDGGSGLGDRTVFYLYNFASPTTSIALNTQGFSDGVIINPVPEPATWAMMLLGFAGIGFVMRRRATVSLPQIA